MNTTQAKVLCPAIAALIMIAFATAARASGSSDAVSVIPFESAMAQSNDDKTFVLSWRATGVDGVRVFSSKNPEQFDLGRPVASGGARDHVVIRLQSPSRWYFELVPNRGAPLTIAERSLHLQHAINYRDAGGYRTTHGHWVRMGLIYRSNALSGLTPTEASQLANLQLKKIDDLRTTGERTRAPDPAVAGASHEVMDMLSGDGTLLHHMMAARRAGNPQQAASEMLAEIKEIYRDFVRLPSARTSLRLFLIQLADRQNLPVAFHCTAGKDRTGWAQAVLLTILGVPRDKIMKDYLLTNVYFADSAVATGRRIVPGVDDETARRLMAADPADLEAAFDEVRVRYGTFDNYLHKGLGLDDETLAAIRTNLSSG
jgi:protein-tyrosine phosphatase